MTDELTLFAADRLNELITDLVTDDYWVNDVLEAADVEPTEENKRKVQRFLQEAAEGVLFTS